MEQQLNQQLADARVQFDAWKESHTQKLELLQGRCTKDAETSEDRIKELYKEELTLLAQAKEAAESQGVREEMLVDVDHQIAELNTRLQEYQSESVGMEHKITLEEKKVAQARASIKRYQKECEQYRLEKELGLVTYEKRLGLRFERVEDDYLKVVFNHIDPKELEKEFSIIVCVDSDDVYQIPEGSCQPQIPHLESMLEDLRASNDFPGFVRKLRATFVEMATSVSVA